MSTQLIDSGKCRKTAGGRNAIVWVAAQFEQVTA